MRSLRIAIAAPLDRPSYPASINWLRTWVLALAVLAGTLGALEAFWRARGFRPDVPDTVDLWRFWRSRIYEPHGKVVVFLGTSRIRGDLDLDVLTRSYPAHRFVQLGVSGNVSPIGTLRSLAIDTRFRGVVICELAAPFLEPSRWADQGKYFLQSIPSAPFEALIYAQLRDHAALLDPRVGILRLVRFWFSDGFLSPSRCCAHFDRSLSYSDIPVRRAVDEELVHQKSPKDKSLMEGLAEIRESVKCINGRGGAVVLVGLPSGLPPECNATNSGFHNLKWSRIAEITGAVCIPLDVGDSRGQFRCSDHVHLGTQEALRLTEYFVAELGRHHLLD